jgi:hypothetical protein
LRQRLLALVEELQHDVVKLPTDVGLERSGPSVDAIKMRVCELL